MGLPQTIIPVAFIFTNEIKERYDRQYASTITEWLTVEDAIKTFDEKNATHFYVPSIVTKLKITDQCQYAYVIYTPNNRRLNMAALGEFGQLIVVVDTVAKRDRLIEFNSAATDLIEISHRFLDYQNEVESCIENGMLDSVCNTMPVQQNLVDAANPLFDSLTSYRNDLIARFKKEFCVSMSLANR